MPIAGGGQRRSKRLSICFHDPLSAAMEAGQGQCAQTPQRARARVLAAVAALERVAWLTIGMGQA